VQLAHVNGFGGEVAPPTNRIYGGGENDVRGFDIRAASPYTFIPNRVQFNLTNPDGTTVPRDPTNPSLGNIQIPAARLPPRRDRRRHQLYQQPGVPHPDRQPGDLRLLHRLRPHRRSAARPACAERRRPPSAQQRRSMAARPSSTAPASAARRSRLPRRGSLDTVPGTNFVPRMSNGAELQVILPIVNAPFRHLLRLQPAAPV
jgi:outer membrane protein insertion porin family